MEHLAAPWVRTSIIDDHGSLRITLRVRRNLFVVALLGAWLLVWAAAEATLLVAAFGADVTWLRELSPPPAYRAAFVIAFTLTGAFVAWRLLWNLEGREILTVSARSLALRREILGLGRTRVFDLEQMRSLRVGTVRDNPVYPSLGRMFVGKGNSYLAFDYDRRTYRLGRGLMPSEASYLLETIRHWVDAE